MTKISRRQALKAGVGTLFVAVVPQTISSRDLTTPEPEEQKVQKFEILSDHAITHGGLQVVHHPELDAEVRGQTCIRYLRFGKQVEIDHLELGRHVYGRGTPLVPIHPAHLVISVLDGDNFTWKTIREVDFPAEPEIMGAGLSQDMKMEDIEAHFSKVLAKPAYRIDLNGYQADHLRVICDREHPVWSNHGECNGGIYNVPFGILDKLVAFGKPTGKSLFDMTYNPVLTQRTFHPVAPEGMQVHDRPEMLLFQSKYLSVGFSLQRPLLMHFGWNILGNGQPISNRLNIRGPGGVNGICGVSGPILRTLYGDFPSHNWSGEVTVEGNRIFYQT